jgi:hypothetical protein
VTTIDQPRTNLPHALTTFIGRDRELTDVSQLLTTARLLTLVGTGAPVQPDGNEVTDRPTRSKNVELRATVGDLVVPGASLRKRSKGCCLHCHRNS